VSPFPGRYPSLALLAGVIWGAIGLALAGQMLGASVWGGVLVIQTVVGVWWGSTFTGYLPLLWPLAYLTHTLLGRADALDRAGIREVT